jgi:hypothetical protein
LRAKKEAWESHFMLSIVQKNVREWTLTLPSELPFWEFESWWTFKFSEGDSKGQNSLDWKFFILLEIFWNVDVWNGLTWPIWTPETQVMAKRRVENQIGNLTFDH